MEDIQPQKEQISIQFIVCRKEFKAHIELHVANNGEEKTRTSCSERVVHDHRLPHPHLP